MSNPSEIDIKDLIYAECKALEITARKFADTSISGAYKSLKRGSGIEFEEARIYTPSDDARRIDWKVTARKQKPYIKSFREEREQSIVLIVDGTYSTLLGVEESKSKRILEVAAFIGSIATFNQDLIGSLSFTNYNFNYTKPKRGFNSVFKILHDIISIQVKNSEETEAIDQKQLPFSEVLQNVGKIIKKKSQLFIISDFNFKYEFESPLKSLSKKHDVYCISIEDALETKLPEAGTYLLKNPENGEENLFNFSNKKARNAIIENIKNHRENIQLLFKRQKIPFLTLNSDSDVRSCLFSFFKEQCGKR